MVGEVILLIKIKYLLTIETKVLFTTNYNKKGIIAFLSFGYFTKVSLYHQCASKDVSICNTKYNWTKNLYLHFKNNTWLLTTQTRTYCQVELLRRIIAIATYMSISARECGEDTYRNQSPSGMKWPLEITFPAKKNHHNHHKNFITHNLHRFSSDSPEWPWPCTDDTMPIKTGQLPIRQLRINHSIGNSKAY